MRLYEACLAMNTVCPRDPHFFMPFFGHAIIAFVDVAVLMLVADGIEARFKRREPGASEWGR